MIHEYRYNNHLDLIAVLIIIYLHDFDILRLDLVFIQDLLGLVAEGTVALGDDEHRLLGNLFLDLIKSLFRHDDEQSMCQLTLAGL